MIEKLKSICSGIPDDQKTPYPEWEEAPLMRAPDDRPREDDLVAAFVNSLDAAHGVCITSLHALAALLERESAICGYIDPSLLPILEDQANGGTLEGLMLDLHTSWDRNQTDQYHFGMTRASLGIAETGTIVLTDKDTSARLGALAPWIHVAVLSKGDIVPTVAEAIARLPKDDPSVIWVTGPSKTADIEGVLIEGVHGPGLQACWLVE